jgi:hypothetical protein
MLAKKLLASMVNQKGKPSGSAPDWADHHRRQSQQKYWAEMRRSMSMTDQGLKLCPESRFGQIARMGGHWSWVDRTAEDGD